MPKKELEKARPAFYRRGAIRQRSDSHGPSLPGIVYGVNSKIIAEEIAHHISHTIRDKHADGSVGPEMIRATAKPDKGNNLMPNEHAEAWFPESAGPSRQEKATRSPERRVLADGTVKKRGKAKA